MNPGDKALCDPAPQEARHVDGAGGGEKAWTVLFGQGSPPIRIEDGRGIEVAQMQLRADGEHTKFAHLIAAAPDLYEALAAVKAHDDFVPVLPRRLLAEVVAALASARGEQPSAGSSNHPSEDSTR